MSRPKCSLDEQLELEEKPVPDTPVWLNTDDAAAYIGITPATLRRLVERGEVVAFQIGRVRRYRQADLDAFLESARVTPQALRCFGGQA